VPATDHETHANQSEVIPENRDSAEKVKEGVLAAGTSFYWGMRLLPKPRRDAMFAIYGFCREVDDIADEPGEQAEKQAGLKEWRAEIERLYKDEAPKTVIGQELKIAIARFQMRRDDFIAVIDGMEMDAVEDIRGPSLEKLDLYCARVASAVGHLSIYAFGAPEQAGREVADALGRALQLSNILRDVVEDAERGRLYLPREILERHGLTEERYRQDPTAILDDPALPKVCADLGQEARRYFTQAQAAMARCPYKTMRPARLMMEVYDRILQRLEDKAFENPRERVSLSKPLKIWLAFRFGLF